MNSSEREAIGKERREAVPRSSHGDWKPGADRPDPIEVLKTQNETRVQELLPIRHSRMLVSALAFYRGNAALMAADLSSTPNADLRVQLCGDAHLSNFGSFGAPDRRLIFDINDFDETMPGPFEWDLKRLAASFEIAGRDRGLGDSERRAAVLAATRTYREAMRKFAAMPNTEVWYSRLDVKAIEKMQANVTEEQRKVVKKTVKKARRKTSMRALSKLTRVEDGELRIVSDPPLIVPIADLTGGIDPEFVREYLNGVLGAYKDTLPPDTRRLAEAYTYADAAHKVVGVGSVGTRAWIVLLFGRDTKDPLFLQLKEAGPSALEPYLGDAGFDDQGQRVVEGQRLMQAAGDIFLGWLRMEGLDGKRRDFYVRQLWDGKGSVEVETMSAEGIGRYAELCGWTLARAHARSGDSIEIASYLGSGEVFDEAIAAFAQSYADQNDRDFAALEKAVANGELPVDEANPEGASLREPFGASA